MNTPSSSSLVVRTLYRNLLRATKPFTINPSSSSSEARVLNCLLHRTGSDDLISDWDGFVASNPKDDIEPQDQARDLTYSYGSKQSQQQHQSPHHHHQQQNDIPSHRTQERLFRRLLREAVAGDNYGVRKLRIPSEIEEKDTRRLREIIRREFRCKSDDGSDISSLSATTTSDAASVHFDIETRKQVAFTALRELNKKLSYYDQLQTTSPEPVPEQAAFNVTRLEIEPSSNYLKPGTFLIAHPHMADTWFDKAVICILEHKPDDDDGRKKRGGAGRQRRRRSFTGDVKTLGIVVNRTSINHETGENRTLKDAFEQNSIPGRLSNIFGNSMVREGGPVLHTGLQMLHSAPSAGGGDDEDDQDENVAMIGGTLVPSIPPDGDDSSSALYSDRATYFNGDTFQAASAIEEGSVDRDDISFFLGTSTWYPGQLEDEVAQGFWIPCRGPSEIALTGICDHGQSSSSKRPLADLWLSMMSACGEDEAKFAHLLYDADWDENGQACDDFDDDDNFDIEVAIDYL